MKCSYFYDCTISNKSTRNDRTLLSVRRHCFRDDRIKRFLLSKKYQPRNTPEKSKLSKSEARERLSRFQKYIGLAFFVSAFFGIYLLATDKSLWLLAVSHAYGLVAICVIDIGLGVANLISDRRIIIPSL